MKGYLVDVAAGSLSGIVWILFGSSSAIVNSILPDPSGIQSMVFIWLLPALILFFIYTRLPLYKKMHQNNWKTILCSLGLFFVVGFFVLTYFFYGLLLVFAYDHFL